jgi:hypothetical protein
MKMLTAAEARTKVNAENSKFSFMVLTLINKRIKKACRNGQVQVSIQIGLIPLEERHVKHVLSVLEENGYNCSAHQLKTDWGEASDWMFTIKW